MSVQAFQIVKTKLKKKKALNHHWEVTQEIK